MPKLRLNKYGWRRDKPDIRDYKFSAPRSLVNNLPVKASLQGGCPAPYDQQNLGSCTGQALGGLVQYNLIRQNPVKSFLPSALFIYYNERVLENSINEDSGAELRNGIKSLARWGVCAEQYHPYVIARFKSKPPQLAYKNALPHKIAKYEKIIQVGHDLKACIAEGFPFVFGFMVYESFDSETSRTGVLKMPERNERALGGHAVLACAYDDETRTYLIRNSYGKDWGNEGYFTMPYEYLEHPDLAADFWTIRSVGEKS